MGSYPKLAYEQTSRHQLLLGVLKDCRSMHLLGSYLDLTGYYFLAWYDGIHASRQKPVTGHCLDLDRDGDQKMVR
jgi:hypothetical protein